MSSEYYQTFGIEVPPLLGRSQELAAIRRRWETQHISVVGPKYYGKTVLMEHLKNVSSEEGHFAAVVLWKEADLRGNPPRNDAEFWAALRNLLYSQAEITHEYLPKNAESANAESILDVFRFVEADGKRVLLLWDGLDECLLTGDLSPNLWNQLTKLASMKSAKLIVSTRKKLIELVPTSEAKGSDFWRRFSHVVDLGKFAEKDWDQILEPLQASGIGCDLSAKKELSNWTGGIPLLVCSLCNRLLVRTHAGSKITKVDVDREAVGMDHRCVELVWRDLPEELREDFAKIAQNQVLARGQLNALRAEDLQNRGLILESGGNLRPATKLMAQYAVQLTDGLPDLRRQFGTDDQFLQNVQLLLELRLGQVKDPNGDLSELKYHVSQIVKGLHHPGTAMEMMRGVFDRAAALMLKLEFPEDSISPELVSAWKFEGKLNKPERDRDILEQRIPRLRGNKMKLLGLLFDHNAAGEPQCRQSTFHLVDFVFNAGKYGQHAVEIGEAVPIQFAVSATFAAIELCHQLANERAD